MGRDTDFNFGELAHALHLDRMCAGRVKCSKCGKPYGVCSVVETQLTEGNTMLPRPGAQPQAAPATGGRRQQSGIPYITETQLSLDKKRCRIIGVKVNDAPLKEGQKRYSDVIIKFAMGGETYLEGFKVNNPNYEKLTTAFGQDENRWLEREFFYYLEEDDFDHKLWKRVEAVTADNDGEPEGKKKKGK